MSTVCCRLLWIKPQKRVFFKVNFSQRKPRRKLHTALCALHASGTKTADWRQFGRSEKERLFSAEFVFSLFGVAQWMRIFAIFSIFMPLHAAKGTVIMGIFVITNKMTLKGKGMWQKTVFTPQTALHRPRWPMRRHCKSYFWCLCLNLNARSNDSTVDPFSPDNVRHSFAMNFSVN